MTAGAEFRAIIQSYSQPVRLIRVSPYHPSALAGYAVHRAAIVHADFLKRTLTGRARQTATAVHQQFLREISRDRKSTRLNSSHVAISYAVFCLKKKKRQNTKYI